MAFSQTNRRTVLIWHVRGSWMNSFVAGGHRYLIPVDTPHDPDGRGLCGHDWPAAEEIRLDELRDQDIDLVVLQRPHELELTARLSGRRPGIDVPAVYVEHNTPRPFVVESPHPVGERDDIPLIHVTDYNRLMWDNGCAPTTVINHGIADPGHLYTGDVAAAGAVVNEPLRRWRTVGADLLGQFAESVPVDVWGIGTEDLNDPARRCSGVIGHGDLRTDLLMKELAHRRVYLHTARWTSLDSSLLEAMFLGMPVVAVASTMAPLVVPPEAGIVSADLDTLRAALSGLIADRYLAEVVGKAARDYATEHFGLDRFLHEWEQVIQQQCAAGL
ncbi:glycosyltransferase [[Mycobacterium] nativiensis]|uniref:Glycosyltransferase family 1 protein n=1 Tax=[Mycobacterium] nativiensis TaxID=2855503 RepID=A0ABU5XZD6_9MYCO|nr:glycosyltransferase family 1 protein [Mycolicibacter sp. MYC340]MEB3033203.1 glycosyltransferase family 1 protein [Mycolicibacter sp. MYC340]